MTDQYRKERIERLLYELKHELTVGMMQGEIDESLGFDFIVPVSKSIPRGVVYCRFETRPMVNLPYMSHDQTGLRVIDGGKK